MRKEGMYASHLPVRDETDSSTYTTTKKRRRKEGGVALTSESSTNMKLFVNQSFTSES